MPRNAAGVYSLPDPPRVPNTVIDSPDENITRDDIATELTNSLDRNGRGGMLAPFRIADGTLAAPGLAFLNEPGTGLYRESAGVMAFAVQGTKVMQMIAGQVGFPNTPIQSPLQLGNAAGTAQLFLTGGTAATEGPMIRLRRGAADEAIIGIESAVLGNNSNSLLIHSVLGNNIKMRSAGNTVAEFHIGGLQINAGYNLLSLGNVTADLQFLGRDGPAGQPGFSFTNESNSGLYRAAAAQLAISCVGVEVVRFVGGGISLPAGKKIFAVDGTVNFAQGISIPSGSGLYLDGASDTFIVEGAPNTMSFIVGGIQRLELTGNAIFNANVIIPTGQNYYLDGGSNTFITEGAPDRIHLFAGGALALAVGGPGIAQFMGGGISVPATSGIYLDGGGNTFISEGPADTIAFSTGGSSTHTFNATRYQIAAGSPLINMEGGAANAQGPGIQLRRGGALYGYLATESVISANNSNDFMVFAESGVKICSAGFPLASIYVVGPGVGATRYVKMSNNNAPGWDLARPTHEITNNSTDWILMGMGQNASPQGYLIRYSTAAPNNTGNEFLLFIDTAAVRFTVRSNGGIANFQANDVNLSDATVKNYWEPYSTAQLEGLSAAVDAMQYGRYKYRDQTHDDWNHGYVAQQVREAFADAAPELVDYWDDQKKDLLSVYSADLVNINLAVAHHEIRKLKAEVAELKGRLQ